MTRSEPRAEGADSPGSRTRLRQTVVATATGALVAGALLVVAPSAAAAPATITDATFEWGINPEMQGAAFFGGCNYLSAGTSDGTEASYRASEGAVSIVTNGTAPTWATKCDGAATGLNQKVVWSGGTGTVDPETGEATLSFTGKLSLNFYGGMVPFTVENPVITVSPSGDGTVVATLSGYSSSMDNPNEKTPLAPVPGVVVADLSGVDAGATGFTVTPDYAGVEVTVPEGQTPQNRTNPAWGAWPQSFLDFHFATGLGSYWYSSGGAADAKKPPTAITVYYAGGTPGDPGGPGDPGPGVPAENEQVITVTVPETTDPGEFLWSIDGDRSVQMTEAVNAGTYLHSTGALDPITVTDTRAGGPEWSISGQVSDFSGGVDGKYLGWSPVVVSPGAGATAGSPVASGMEAGHGLKDPSVLASATGGHEPGTAQVGADLDLRLPAATPAGSYSATLTITALS